jgi:tetratricopeptide (TPR) repeat protein
MHIRTPRRYRGKRRNLIASRTLLMLIMIGLLGGTGAFVLQNATMLQPIAYKLIGTAVVKAQDQALTIVAPTATATRDPRNDLISANNFWERGSLSEALRLYMPLLSSVPNDMQVHYRVALGMIIQGSLNEAIEYAEMTVNANPFSSDAWAIRAWAYDWAGRTGDAIASALQAKDLDPKNARAWAYLAEAYYSAGQPSRAYDTAENAINLDNTSAEAYRARGYISWNLGDTEAAFTDFNTAYELSQVSNPGLASLIVVDIATIEIGRDNPQGAVDKLKEVLETNPDNTQALLSLGRTLRQRMGDAPQASSILQRCVDVSPESIGCNYELGRAQFDITGQEAAAAESFARAIQLGSQVPQHYYWAANSQISIGNCSRATEFMEAGFELAQEKDDTEIIDALQSIAANCGTDLGPSGAAPTLLPETEATTEPDV